MNSLRYMLDKKFETLVETVDHILVRQNCKLSQQKLVIKKLSVQIQIPQRNESATGKLFNATSNKALQLISVSCTDWTANCLTYLIKDFREFH